MHKEIHIDIEIRGRDLTIAVDSETISRHGGPSELAAWIKNQVESVLKMVATASPTNEVVLQKEVPDYSDYQQWATEQGLPLITEEEFKKLLEKGDPAGTRLIHLITKKMKLGSHLARLDAKRGGYEEISGFTENFNIKLVGKPKPEDPRDYRVKRAYHIKKLTNGGI